MTSQSVNVEKQNAIQILTDELRVMITESTSFETYYISKANLADIGSRRYVAKCVVGLVETLVKSIYGNDVATDTIVYASAHIASRKITLKMKVVA